MPISVHFQKNEPAPLPKPSLEKDLPKNSILYRVPSLISGVFVSGENEIFRMRLPFYQFGTIQTFILELK
jgi:hypothetical protein